MKKSIAIILGAMLIAMAPVNVLAQGVDGTSTFASPRYAYIASLKADCTTENGFATCFGAVMPWTSSYGSQLSITLQEYRDSKWVDVKTWSEQNPSGGVNLTKTYAVSQSKSYRVKVTAKVLSSGGSVLETQTLYG